MNRIELSWKWRPRAVENEHKQLQWIEKYFIPKTWLNVRCNYLIIAHVTPFGWSVFVTHTYLYSNSDKNGYDGHKYVYGIYNINIIYILMYMYFVDNEATHYDDAVVDVTMSKILMTMIMSMMAISQYICQLFYS